MEPKPVHQKQNEQFYNRKASPETMPDIPELDEATKEAILKTLETEGKGNGTTHRFLSGLLWGIGKMFAGNIAGGMLSDLGKSI